MMHLIFSLNRTEASEFGWTMLTSEGARNGAGDLDPRFSRECENGATVFAA
jgi:hypothetical protein